MADYPLLVAPLNTGGGATTNPSVPRCVRKQNKSCDQCRKGKRACNGDSSCGSRCSNCSQTNKECTFEWLRARESSLSSRTAQHELPAAPTLQASLRETGPLAYESQHMIHDDLPFSSVALNPQPAIPTTDPASYKSLSVHERDDQRWTQPSFEDCFEQYSERETLQNPDTSLSKNHSRAISGPDVERRLDEARQCFGDLSPNTSNPESRTLSSSNVMSDPNVHLDFLSFEPQESSPTHHTESWPRPEKSRKRKRRLRETASTDCFVHSSFRSSHDLSQRLNGNIVSQSLMKIYHDSLENALSCWLTERTCPYGARPEEQSPSLLLGNEWGSDWSNRIYQRVFKLDALIARSHRMKFSPQADKAASKALHLAILSFSSQWARNSQRTQTTFFVSSGRVGNSSQNASSETPITDSEHHVSSQLQSEFDHIMQESMWHEARHSLEGAADLQSFRVAFAQILFSLTQRPFDRHRRPSNLFRKYQTPTAPPSRIDSLHQSKSFGDSYPPSMTEAFSNLEEIVDSDEAPLFLEHGLRNVHRLRSKMDQLERKSAAERERARLDAMDFESFSSLDPSNKKTIDLLFWLGVMFDTLSACMLNRPLVVSDEDSELRPEGNDTSSALVTDLSKTTLWGDHFINASNSQPSCVKGVRWPCGYYVAARLLNDAAPVKVLLFRKVARLQTLLSRRSSGLTFEDTISSALQVYEHWTLTFQPFFESCVSYHEELPHRIQSWYVCLAGHWHLAALLLAESVETVDNERLSVQENQIKRTSANLVLNLRQRNSIALSDLARVSTPEIGLESSFSRGSGWHDAVNVGALLTEPWTAVLIRAFVKAASVLLSEIENIGFLSLGPDQHDAILQRCDYCAKALWYLGRKSDAAILAAQDVMDAIATRRKRGAENSDDILNI